MLISQGLWLSQVEHRTLNPAVEGSNPSRPALSTTRVPNTPDIEHRNLLVTHVYHNTMRQKPILSIKQTQDDASNDPLDNFYTGIKSAETLDSYRKSLREFLFLVEEFNGEFEQRAKEFHDFAKNDPDSAKNILKQYAKHLRTRTQKPLTDPDYLKPTVVPNKFKGIKKFLKMNNIPMEWAGIEAIFPEITDVHHTRGYTTEEIQEMLKHCPNALFRFLILVESSSGMRVGGLQDLTWQCIQPIYPSTNGTYTHEKSKATGKPVCASIVVYDGTSDRYVGLISIEAWKMLDAAKTYWKRKMRREPKPNDPVFISKHGRKFARNGIRNKIFKIIEDSGIRTPLLEGQRTREVPITHGMRKRWSKICTERQIHNDPFGHFIRQERLFGHKIAFSKNEQSYFASNIEEAVPQYLEAMPELMISPEFRQLKLIKTMTAENQKLLQSNQEKDSAITRVKELEAKFDRFEKYALK